MRETHQLSLFAQTMLTEEIHTNPDWTGLPGTILEGGYEIQELLEAEHDRAKYKIRVLGGGGIDAFGDFFRADGAAAKDQIAAWEIALRAKHPNLNVPLTTGETELDGTQLMYVVFRKPDEILENAVRERLLTPKEAGEVLVSVARALDHLHSHELVHGCVSSEQIFAVGDSIQLATGCVRRAGSVPTVEVAQAKYVAPESDNVNTRPAADVWCLGATLVESLSRNAENNWRERAGSLPAPFGRIVERCLDPNPETRCKLPEVLALCQTNKQASAQQDRTSVRGAEVREAQVARAPNITPTPVTEVGRTTRRRTTETDTARLRPAKWIYAALIVVAVSLIIWAARPKHASSAAKSTANVSKSTDVAGSTKSSWQTKTLAPEAAFTAAKSHPPAPNAANSSSSDGAPGPKPDVRVVKPSLHTANGPVWRVVVFTYSAAESAQNRAHLINQKHPELNAEVFSPDGHGAPYLVTLGGRMQRDEAARLRQKALRLGLPRDSYIQNYNK